MENWVILTFLYAMFNGFFQCTKKKATEKNSIYEVLAYFSLIAFGFVLFTTRDAFNIEWKYILIILVKSLSIVMAWILSLYALSRMSLSLYSVMNLSRIIFSIMLSSIFLREKITITVLLGLIIVLLGLVLVNINSDKGEKKKTSFKLIVIVLLSCFLSSISGIIDKKIMQYVTSSQLEFWFFLFLTIIYWIILLSKKRKVDFQNIKKNYWILLTAICLAFGDRFLFIANGIPESKVAVMTIIKQFAVIESIILGKIMFKEEGIIKKLACSILIIFGIMITLI